MGISAASVIATTNAANDMAQAAALLRTSAMIAPNLTRCLALNRRRGSFVFLDGSEQGRIYSRLRDEARDARTFEVRAVGGESWKVCDEVGLTMPQVIQSDLGALSARIGRNAFIAGACQIEVAAWYSATEAELLRALALPPVRVAQCHSAEIRRSGICMGAGRPQRKKHQQQVTRGNTDAALANVVARTPVPSENLARNCAAPRLFKAPSVVVFVAGRSNEQAFQPPRASTDNLFRPP